MASFSFSHIRLVLISSLSILLICAHGFFGSGLLAQSESIHPDGKLDFLNFDESRIVSIVIEIAETKEARRKGLMGRHSLNMTNGMLFIYEREALISFWMHNTPISLDMIFVNSKRRIIHIAESTRPMSKQGYGSQMPAQYVVEVPAGFAKFFNIKKGMRIRWQRNQK
jgi:uncharacterized membrane protein (UPF0127 family)